MDVLRRWEVEGVKLGVYNLSFRFINMRFGIVLSLNVSPIVFLLIHNILSLGSIGMAAAFGFLIRKRICLFDLLDRPSVVETDLEFQQVTTDVLEGM